MKKSVIIYALLILTVSVAFAQTKSPTIEAIQKRGVLRAGAEFGYIPFEMYSKAGAPMGFDVDIATELAGRLGVKLEIVNIEWDNLLPSLASNKVDVVISGMTITTERKKSTNFSTPYMSGGQTLLIRKEDGNRIKSFRDINSPDIIITMREFTTAYDLVMAFFPKAKILAADSEKAAINNLLSGRADVHVYDFPYNAAIFAEHKDRLIHLDKPFTYEPFGIAVAKGDDAFLAYINKMLAEMWASGEYAKLHTYWFNTLDWAGDVGE